MNAEEQMAWDGKVEKLKKVVAINRAYGAEPDKDDAAILAADAELTRLREENEGLINEILLMARKIDIIHDKLCRAGKEEG